jgi:hypothetical protein
VDSSVGPRDKRVEDILPPPQADGLDRLEVEKWRWFGSSIVMQRQLENLPILFVPIFVIWFLAVVFGGAFFYEGKVELGIAVFVIAALTSALILIMWKRTNDSR